MEDDREDIKTGALIVLVVAVAPFAGALLWLCVNGGF